MWSEQQPQNARLPQEVTVAILQRNQLDCDALHVLVQSHCEFRVVGASTLLDIFFDTCTRFEPDVALIDAGLSAQAGDIFSLARTLKGNGKVRRFLFLDDLPNHARARQAIAVGSSGYITRRRTFRQLVSAIVELLDGHSPLDGFTSDWLQTGRRAKRCLTVSSPILGKLSSREIEVLQLLAQGRSIATCAQTLQLSTYTIENHKSRIMKKLNVSKAVQLTLMAVREGLITP